MPATRQTAKLVTQHQMIIEHDIRECNLGDFEGKPVSDFIEYIKVTPNNVPFPNGESKIDLSKRVLTAVNKCRLMYEDNLLFVSHGMIYWALLEAIGIPFHYIPNAELSLFKLENKSWEPIKI